MNNAAVDLIIKIIIAAGIILVTVVGIIIIKGAKDFDKISDEDWEEFCRERGYGPE